jgi:CRP/FNR family transcriptional regulator
MLSLHTTPSAAPVAIPDPCAQCDARSASVCAALPPGDLHRLAALATVLTVQPGAAFIQEGDPAEHFYNVTSGAVRLCKLLPDGRRQITGFARPGHFLGLAVRNIYGFSAEALSPVRVCRFSRARYQAVLLDHPELERRLLETAANELVAAQEQMLLLGRKTARERLASFLLAQADAAPGCVQRSDQVDLPMNRTDIADYLGLTIETVSRSMTWLKGQGFIGLPSSSHVVLLRRDRLSELAGGWDDQEA